MSYFFNVGLYSKVIQEALIKELGSSCFHSLPEETKNRDSCVLEGHPDNHRVFLCFSLKQCQRQKTRRFIKYKWEPCCAIKQQHFSLGRIDPPVLVSEWKTAFVIKSKQLLTTKLLKGFWGLDARSVGFCRTSGLN